MYFLKSDKKLPLLYGRKLLEVIQNIYFGWISGVWIIRADVSEHSGCTIFKGGASCLHHLWRWNRQCVSKRRQIKFRHRLFTQKK